LFIFVFSAGFVKINVVYSSTGIVNSVREVQENRTNEDSLNITTFDDQALISIYKESYGYDVVDLGKDIKVEKVVEAYNRYQPKVIGLSALMTTTVMNMK